MNKIIKLFATALGAGYIPIAPGTFGAAVGLLLFFGLSNLPVVHYIIFVLVFILFSVWVSDKAQVLFAEKDPKMIVIDEVAGLLVTMIGHGWSWKVAIAGFILFRIFDITKPFPIRRIEKRYSSGVGVVMDDVLAGVYANICLTGLASFARLAGWNF